MSAEAVDSHSRVRDWMHAGVVSCPPDASFAELARVMSDHRVHAVAVADPVDARHRLGVRKRPRGSRR